MLRETRSGPPEPDGRNRSGSFSWRSALNVSRSRWLRRIIDGYCTYRGCQQFVRRFTIESRDDQWSMVSILVCEVGGF